MSDPTTYCPFCRKGHDTPELLEAHGRIAELERKLGLSEDTKYTLTRQVLELQEAMLSVSGVTGDMLSYEELAIEYSKLLAAQQPPVSDEQKDHVLGVPADHNCSLPRFHVFALTHKKPTKAADYIMLLQERIAALQEDN